MKLINLIATVTNLITSKFKFENTQNLSNDSKFDNDQSIYANNLSQGMKVTT